MAQRPDPASHNATLKLYLCGPGLGGERESERARALPPLTESAAGVRTGVSVSRRGQGHQAVPAGHQGSPPPSLHSHSRLRHGPALSHPPCSRSPFARGCPHCPHPSISVQTRTAALRAYMCVREREINKCRTEPGRAGVVQALRPPAPSPPWGSPGSRPPLRPGPAGVLATGAARGSHQRAGQCSRPTTLRDRFPAIRPDASTQRVVASAPQAWINKVLYREERRGKWEMVALPLVMVKSPACVLEQL